MRTIDTRTQRGPYGQGRPGLLATIALVLGVLLMAGVATAQSVGTASAASGTATTSATPTACGPEHQASGGGEASGEMDRLRAEIAALREQLLIVTAQVGLLDTGVTILHAKTSCMSSAGTDTYFTGCNVHVRDGSGDTDGPTNGLGNLVVGYNESFVPGAERDGSHNVVIGPEHGYSSFGGLVAGFYNTVSAPHASVTGGAFNVASMNRASVTGGERNSAGSLSATVAGGLDNSAGGEFSAVAGGFNNAASERYAVVSGGSMNHASGMAASVTGGSGNQASGMYAAVSGGELNEAGAVNASVTGGHYNRALGSHSQVAGGARNQASARYATVGARPGLAPQPEGAVPGGGAVEAVAPAVDAVTDGEQRWQWNAEAWAQSNPPAPERGRALARRDRAGVDSPFKIPGREFSPRTGSPLGAR